MTEPSDLADQYHGIHPAAPQVDYKRLTWQEQDPRAHRVRVREHTCDCQQIVYELCQAGGLLFVRRLRAPEAHRLWLRILLGQAR